MSRLSSHGFGRRGGRGSEKAGLRDTGPEATHMEITRVVALDNTVECGGAGKPHGGPGGGRVPRGGLDNTVESGAGSKPHGGPGGGRLPKGGLDRRRRRGGADKDCAGGGGSLTTDPPVSAAQRRAMGAAMSGKSNLGIPKSVGKEFIDADPGGKLPAHAKDAEGKSFEELMHPGHAEKWEDKQIREGRGQPARRPKPAKDRRGARDRRR